MCLCDKGELFKSVDIGDRGVIKNVVFPWINVLTYWFKMASSEIKRSKNCDIQVVMKCDICINLIERNV